MGVEVAELHGNVKGQQCDKHIDANANEAKRRNALGLSILRLTLVKTHEDQGIEAVEANCGNNDPVANYIARGVGDEIDHVGGSADKALTKLHGEADRKAAEQPRA